MPEPVDQSPEILPILSSGRHRNPRKGACFMELASVLAGEKWSDHPRCTQPLLGDLARWVNDCTSDDERSRLAVLIPDVVGVVSDDPRLDARIALRCAATAIPVADESRQRVLAVSLLTTDCVLAGLDGRLTDELEPISVAALASAPKAAEWAHAFVRQNGISARGFRRHAAPTAVQVSVAAIAESCVADPDTTLRRLLTDVIADCQALLKPSSTDSVPAQETADSTS
jgi:hypothetical protein